MRTFLLLLANVLLLSGIVWAGLPDESVRPTRALIFASSPDGYTIDGVRKGTRISLSYVGGLWKSFGHLPTENPDLPGGKDGDTCRLAIALPSVEGKGGKVLVVVPTGTQKRPFVFTAQADYGRVVLRINDPDNTYDLNPGMVEYDVRVLLPAR
jgi:hypothetical protein